MNAGSFGHVMGDCVNRVQVWTREQGLVWYGRDSLAMGYRHFSVREVEGFYLLAQVELALEKEPRGEDAIRARMREAMDKKQALQPVSDWSAGCVFKNPEAREPAGLLLDRHGFRGRQLGGMVYSPMHANFLVNTGEGTSDQAFELIAMARDVVRQQEGINLELEVKVWESR